MTVQFSVGGNYNSSFLHKSSPTSLNFTGQSNKQIIQITNEQNCTELIFQLNIVNVTTSSNGNVAELGYFDVFTEECLESRCLVPWSVPGPGGTLLLPVNTVSSVQPGCPGGGCDFEGGAGVGTH